jgi:hypothetical protein
MNSVEERLREALRAQAEEFTAHPDAWRQLTARSRGRGAASWPRWRRSRFSGPMLIPAAAAVAVVAVVATVLLAVHGISGRSGESPATGATTAPRTASPSASRGPVQAPDGPLPGPDREMLKLDPPLSAVVPVRVPGIVKKIHGQTEQVTSYFWLGRNNPASWPDWVNPGPQLCNNTVNDTTGQSGGFCWPAPAPGPGHLATVTGSEGDGTDQTIMVGEAAVRVASVTAVLPGGRTYPGAVSTGRGLRGVVWTAAYPWSTGVPYTKGVHLVFRDASGRAVTVLDPHSPAGPPQTVQPASGGVTLFAYPASPQEPAGTVQAYLVHGEVGFWSPLWSGTISQQTAAGAPVLGGLSEPFVIGADGTFTRLEALGYAHADVARVVLRADGRQLASVATTRAGWPGSNLRLWHVRLPLNPQQAGSGRPAVTATAYDAAGHVLGQVKLGQMW